MKRSIGSQTSEHFANLYLSPLDRFAKEALRVPGYVRYMDDLLLFADSKAFLWECHGHAVEFCRERLDLALPEDPGWRLRARASRSWE